MSLAQALGDWPRPAEGYRDAQALARVLGGLDAAGLARLPGPAEDPLLRWQALAQVAGHDLGLCKFFEGHTDALAIMAELNAAPPPAGSLWGTWAAEPPNARVEAREEQGQVRLSGRKAWCSGAQVLSHALLTAWDAEGQQRLVAVALAQPGVHGNASAWHAVGMAATGSGEVLFDRAEASWVGAPGQYVQRPGFWQGAIGIAACWYGASRQLALSLHRHCQRRDDPHALAHLGHVDSALHAARAVLVQAAQCIQARPQEDVQSVARRARAVVEASAEQVLYHTGRALGAAPFCLDEHFARLSADLPVFLRQSHAERDLAVLGQQLTPLANTAMWQL